MPPRSKAIKHGTYGGYQAHKRRGEDPCDPCDQAQAEYMAAYRARDPQAREAELIFQGARRRAMTRLAAENPERMHTLTRIELIRANQDPEIADRRRRRHGPRQGRTSGTA